jgi:hypothetical protein
LQLVLRTTRALAMIGAILGGRRVALITSALQML